MPPRGLRSWHTVLGGAFALVVGLYTYHALSVDLWDDAFFFKRTGLNLVRDGVAAWNVGDGPVHGNTSQLFQLLAAAVVAITPGHYFVGIKLVLAASLFATFWLLARPVLRTLLGREPLEHDAGPSAVVLCGLSAPTMLLLIGSGMETLLALAVLALYLWVLARLPAGAPGRAQVAGFAGAVVLVYLARPDAVLIALVVAAVVLYEPEARWRQRRLAVLIGAALLALVLLLGLLKLYYGTALPLSFYLKSSLLTPYDEAYQRLDAVAERRALATWLALNAPFIYLAFFGRGRWTVALLAGAGVFVAYHAGFTLGIMGYHTRFFLPASVPVILAAALAWPSFARRHVLWKSPAFVLVYPALLALAYRRELVEAWKVDLFLGWLGQAHYRGFVLPTLALFVAPLWPRGRAVILVGALPLLAVTGAILAVPAPTRIVWHDGPATRVAAAKMNTMTGIYEVKRCMPEPTHIFHSELGVPGVLFPDSRVTDLSGLMNPRLVFGQPSFDDYCLADPPEVLFLPHRTHKRLNQEIKRSRCFALFVHPTGIPESSSTLYIRRDKLAAFEACRTRR